MRNIKSLNRKELGRLGENVAVKFLKKKGYLIKHIRFKLGRGEIDIVGIDRKQCLCFIEVKTKKVNDEFNPLFSITDKKQKQLSKLALLYMQKFNIYDTNARFDVITVIFKANNRSYDVDLLKNAFPLHSKYL